MPVPISQMVSVASYVLKQKILGNRRYPLVLMLEPLYRCNLSCAGCGKIQYPSQILRSQLSVEECLRAVDECPAPVVSIPGGEPLLHPEVEKIVEGLVARKKYVYLCTNALLLEEKLDLFTPTRYLNFSVHLDGLEEEHDFSVCRDGTYRQARRAIQAALARGFRVTTNTTLFETADPERTRRFFDEAMALGVEGMTISPGYSYEKAPNQENFLGRERTVLLSTHVMQEVEATCSRLVILSRGKLAAEGSVQDLLSSRTGGARYVVEVAGQVAARRESIRGLRIVEEILAVLDGSGFDPNRLELLGRLLVRERTRLVFGAEIGPQSLVQASGAVAAVWRLVHDAQPLKVKALDRLAERARRFRRHARHHANVLLDERPFGGRWTSIEHALHVVLEKPNEKRAMVVVSAAFMMLVSSILVPTSSLPLLNE